MDKINLNVEANEAVRLDVYLSSQLKQFSRSYIQKLIESGLIRIGERSIKASQLLRGGETITISLPEPKPLALEAENIPLSIIYEDGYLAVVNKPAGMVTHPGAGRQTGTLVNALLHHMAGSLSGISGVMRPGIVHRLDKDTSGLLLIAKEDAVHRQLAEQIRHKTAKRIYYALVEGQPQRSSGVVDKPIGRHPVQRKQMAIVDSGRAAVTYWQVVKRFSKFTLLRLSLSTGRTHQIRVHMASLGLPIVGDLLYNHKTTGTCPARAKLGLVGQALHAAYLSFSHPQSGRLLEFEASLPEDFQQLLDRLS